MDPDLVIGLDVGTTACKALAVSRQGSVVASAAADYPLHMPTPGFAEQDVAEIWRGVRDVLTRLTAQIDAKRLAGMALSGAMHSLLPVDRQGNPLTRAMTWADLRAVNEAAELRQADPQGEQYRSTGCPHQWLYHPAKLRWVRRHHAAVFAEAVRFVAIKDWLLHQLTGIWATDIGIASASGLLGLQSRRWDGRALREAGIDEAQLPPLAQPHDKIGRVSAAAARQTGLPAGLPVMPGGGDGGMANIGAGAGEPGAAVVTIGTSGAVRITVREPLLDPRQRTWCYALTRDLCYAGGAINNGGLAIDAVRRLLYDDLEKEAGFTRLFADAQSVPAGADGVVMLPYFAGERSPHWRPELKASIHGLTLRHDRSHIARAALEGVAFCLADVWRALCDSLATPPTSIRLTGGVTRSRVWSRIVCDVLGVPVQLTEAGDASALGAAAVAHLGVGLTGSLNMFSLPPPDAATLEPDAQSNEMYAQAHRRIQELTRVT